MEKRQAKSPLREWIEALVKAGILAFLIITFVAQSYVVDGISMLPTLEHGQRLIVEKVSYRFRDPGAGDIIVLNVPNAQYIKRVIAVGGDIIQARDGTVYVNGAPLDEPYVSAATYPNFGPLVVPEGHLWVMGDNRPRSNDSRGTVGFLDEKDVVGRAIFRYWPLTAIGLVN
ncbi:MAG TPA: signal peptidase I [Firmicutes bacterium]|jgi:signal peptidase I|nr:MAG: hypothetical protein AA931_01485 [Peptococcaceae bacterium 1109]HHT72827.1 signal peptidase I [Bacillota bacterium]